MWGSRRVDGPAPNRHEGPMRFSSLVLAAVLAGATITPVAAQSGPAASATALPAIPPAADTPYPGGAMTLAIDATDVLRGIYRVRQTIPVAPGTRSLTLLYPSWLPGHHAPRGPISQIVGLTVTAGGQTLNWRRDPVNVNAFHLDLPAGATTVVAQFVHTSPLRSAEGRVTMTPAMLNLQWEKMSLYPAGHYVRRIGVQPSLTLPDGWTPATALTGRKRSGNRYDWGQTDYETLVDSPVFAGAHTRQWPLGNAAQLNVMADAPSLLVLRDEHLATMQRLMNEALATFGAPPFEHYEFLIALSDRIGGIGLEHLRSTEIQLEPRNFYDWDSYSWDRNVIAHELVHAWNGKYRRPAKLWTPDYDTPMQDDLLWVYEGQTQFWGWVLSARSGTQTKEVVLGMIADAAGDATDSPGRAWRSLHDTTFAPIAAARRPKPYQSYARGEDYYREGALIWLEADQVIRAGTNGNRGLDDFARAFFAHSASAPNLNLYEREDVIDALNRTYPFDWQGFFRDRVDLPAPRAPLKGIEMGGYRLVWKDRPNPYETSRMEHSRVLDLAHSIGITVDRDGFVSAPVWDGPAFKAGIVTGALIVAVDTIAFSPEGLRQAIVRAAADRRPIELLLRRGGRFETVSVPYYGGLRWPWLEPRNQGSTMPLDRLLEPRAVAK